MLQGSCNSPLQLWLANWGGWDGLTCRTHESKQGDPTRSWWGILEGNRLAVNGKLQDAKKKKKKRKHCKSCIYILRTRKTFVLQSIHPIFEFSGSCVQFPKSIEGHNNINQNGVLALLMAVLWTVWGGKLATDRTFHVTAGANPEDLGATWGGGTWMLVRLFYIKLHFSMHYCISLLLLFRFLFYYWKN